MEEGKKRRWQEEEEEKRMKKQRWGVRKVGRTEHVGLDGVTTVLGYEWQLPIVLERGGDWDKMDYQEKKKKE